MSDSLKIPLIDNANIDHERFDLTSAGHLSPRTSNQSINQSINHLRAADQCPVDISANGSDLTDLTSSKYSLFTSHLPPLVKLSTPVILTYILQYSLNIIALMFVGRLGATMLAGASIAMTASNLTGYSVLIGFATAIDTLSSQALGSGAHKQVGLVVQRTGAIVLVLCAAVAIVWYFMAELLVLLGQDPAVCVYAGQYAWIMTASLVAMAWFEVLRKYLICLKQVRPLVVILAFANVLLIGLSYLFIHVLDFGFAGGPWATVLTQWSMLAATVAMCRWKGWHTSTWPAFSLHEAFREWKPILTLGSGGAGMLSAKYGCLLILSLMAGWLGSIQLGAFGVISQLQTIIVMLPYGIGATVAPMVGNRLGAGEPHDAKWTAITALGSTIAVQSVVILIVCLSISVVATLFTSNANVLAVVTGVAPLAAFLFFVDAVQGVMGGVLRGLGLQKMAAITSLVAYYLIGIPVALLLTRALRLDVHGLVIGLFVAIGVTAFVFTLTVLSTNWELASVKAQKLHSLVPLERRLTADKFMDVIDASPIAPLFRLPITVEMEQLTETNSPDWAAQTSSRKSST